MRERVGTAVAVTEAVVAGLGERVGTAMAVTEAVVAGLGESEGLDRGLGGLGLGNR